jgi:hypothetical protein
MDHDGDGLNDVLETSGIVSAFGWVKTDPYKADTDGDGLIDSMEVGELMVDPSTGLKYYKLLSDPLRADTDGDTLNDFNELKLGTNPCLKDTDNDKYDDNVDPEPLSPDNNKKPGMSDLEIGRAIVLGAVFGQSGSEGGLAAGYVDEEISSSVYYLVGWIGFSLVPGIGGVADVRDAVQSFISGKPLDAALIWQV